MGFYGKEKYATSCDPIGRGFLIMCQPNSHEYVDFYSGWGYVDKDQTKLMAWVFCKKCLDKQKIYLDMGEIFNEEEY